MPHTLADLFDMAIQAELKAEAIYATFGARFAHDEEVSKFWLHYAGEEADHARWLEEIRSQLPAEKLAEAADPQAVLSAEAALKFLGSGDPLKIRNLDEAYQLANEAETSEVITVFNFLVENFSDDPKTRSMLRQQLRHHINDITFNFPKRFAQQAIRLSLTAK